MKNFVVGGVLFVGGLLTGYKVHKKMMLMMLSDKKFQNELGDKIMTDMKGKFGEERVDKAMSILEETEAN